MLSLGSKSLVGVAQELPALYPALNKLLSAPTVSVSWDLCSTHSTQAWGNPSSSPQPRDRDSACKEEGYNYINT